MALPQLKSPIARAVVPVLFGIVVIILMAGLLWLIAAYVTDNPEGASEDFAPTEWTVGSVDNLAAIIDADGPLLFRRPGSADNDRSIVLDHQGNEATDGWRVYGAYPADKSADCALTQVQGSATFTDCDGRTIDVSELAPPDDGVFPRVDDDTTLVIDFRGSDGAVRATSAE